MGRMPSIVAVVVVLAACRMPPPVAYDTADARVRAGTFEEARSLAGIVDEQRRAVAALVPGLSDRPVEVWLEDSIATRGDPPKHVAGYTLLERAAPVGRVRVDARFADREQVVAHELVHALLGPDWRTLPGILEEGLCDWAAAESAGEAGDVLRASRRTFTRAALGQPIPFEVVLRSAEGTELYRERFLIGSDEPIEVSELAMALALPIEHLSRDYDRLPSGWYGIGLMLVDRIAVRHGIERLHRACVEARKEGRAVAPLDDLLALAGLTRRDLDRAGLVRALDEPTLPAHAWLAMIATTQEALAHRLWARAAALQPRATVIELLEPGRLMLELEDGRAIDMAADGRFRAALVDAWLTSDGFGAPATIKRPASVP